MRGRARAAPAPSCAAIRTIRKAYRDALEGRIPLVQATRLVHRASRGLPRSTNAVQALQALEARVRALEVRR